MEGGRVKGRKRRRGSGISFDHVCFISPPHLLAHILESSLLRSHPLLLLQSLNVSLRELQHLLLEGGRGGGWEEGEREEGWKKGERICLLFGC